MVTSHNFSPVSPLKNCFAAGRASVVSLVNTDEKKVLNNSPICLSSEIRFPFSSVRGPTKDLALVLLLTYLKKDLESFIIFLDILLSNSRFAWRTNLRALLACYL